MTDEMLVNIIAALIERYMNSSSKTSEEVAIEILTIIDSVRALQNKETN